MVSKLKGRLVTYPKWVMVGFVWFIGAQIMIKIEPSENFDQAHLIKATLLCLVASYFALFIAHSSSLEVGSSSDETDPQLHIVRAVPAVAAYALIWKAMTDSDLEAVNKDAWMWLVPFFFILSACVWRATARIGLGNDGAFSQEATG
jgi:hypothetical protein